MISINGKEFNITRKMFTFRTLEKTVQGKRSEQNFSI